MRNIFSDVINGYAMLIATEILIKKERSLRRRKQRAIHKLESYGIDFEYMLSDKVQDELKKLIDEPLTKYVCSKCRTELLTDEQHPLCICGKEMMKVERK